VISPALLWMIMGGARDREHTSAVKSAHTARPRPNARGKQRVVIRLLVESNDLLNAVLSARRSSREEPTRGGPLSSMICRSSVTPRVKRKRDKPFEARRSLRDRTAGEIGSGAAAGAGYVH